MRRGPRGTGGPRGRASPGGTGRPWRLRTGCRATEAAPQKVTGQSRPLSQGAVDPEAKPRLLSFFGLIPEKRGWRQALLWPERVPRSPTPSVWSPPPAACERRLQRGGSAEVRGL